MVEKWDGHIHGLKCEKCGKVLNADGNYPAETYAGTMNGLCYPCTLAGPYIEKTYRDGAVLWSYPPSLPSWRRDRETFRAYSDCQACGGKGREKERPCSVGHLATYYGFCRPCMTRFSTEPLRAKFDALGATIMKRADADYRADYQRELKARGLKKKDVLPREIETALAAPYLERVRKHSALRLRWATRRGVHA